MGLKIPRSKGRAGSIPASGTKQIKGLHEILHAGPLFFVPQFFIFAPPLAYCQSTKIQDIPATAKPLAPHARNGIANPLNMAAISGARCNRIAIDAHRCVRESRKSHAGYFPSLGVLPNHQTNPIEYDFVLCTWSHPRLGTHSLPRYAGRIL